MEHRSDRPAGRSAVSAAADRPSSGTNDLTVGSGSRPRPGPVAGIVDARPGGVGPVDASWTTDATEQLRCRGASTQPEPR